jgi:hypothetical protein
MLSSAQESVDSISSLQKPDLRLVVASYEGDNDDFSLLALKVVYGCDSQ